MSSSMNADQLKHLIREVPDFPKKGILVLRHHDSA